MKPIRIQLQGICFFAMLGLATLLASCGRDGGSRPMEPVPPPPPPHGEIALARLIPARTVVGDTVVAQGSGFGSTPGSMTFRSGVGDSTSAQILAWSDSTLKVLVPAGAIDGPVAVHAGGVDSNTLSFSVAPRLISYTTDLIPGIFENIHIGCAACHGGTNNLYLDTAQHLMEGTSIHGPVVHPRDSAGSILLQKVSPNPPFGAQMPQGGTPLDDAQMLLIADWIDQGARDN